MKRYLLLLLLIGCTTPIIAKCTINDFITDSCNNITSYSMMKDNYTPPLYKQSNYWKKYKRLKISGISTLGLGTIGIIIGWIGSVGNNPDTNQNWKDDKKAWNTILYSGVGLTVSSIPLFVFAKKNKKKALRNVDMSLKVSCISSTLSTGIEQQQPALGIYFNF